MPRASFLSVLTGRQDRKRSACRVSIHVTGMPASRSPRWSRSDSGQASIPTSSMIPDHSASRLMSGPGSLGTALPLYRAVAVDNADRGLGKRYVEPDENTHGGLLVSWLNPDRP